MMHRPPSPDAYFYTFYMAGFKVHIKCDSRKVPEKYSKIFLKDGAPWLIPLVSFRNSSELKDFNNAIYQSHNLQVWKKPPPFMI